jgi:hypothetical protein
MFNLHCTDGPGQRLALRPLFSPPQMKKFTRRYVRPDGLPSGV